MNVVIFLRVVRRLSLPRDSKEVLRVYVRIFRDIYRDV